MALSVLLAIGALLPLGDQHIRVEPFPRGPAQTLTLRAGLDPLRICSILANRPCLHLKPGEAGQCVAAAAAVRCRTVAATKEFPAVSVTSASPFRFQVGVKDSSQGQTTRAGVLRVAEVWPARKGLRVLAPVDLETYVAGVLTGEASTLRSPAALAAMAVVARTWALRSRGRHRAQGFDFCSLTHCQVFRLPSEPEDAPSPAVAEAVAITRSVVLKYRGQLADPYFSANCGGITAAAGDVWPDRLQPYLQSVRDPYCAGSEQSSWQQTVPMETVTWVLKIRLKLALEGPIRDLQVAEKDTSGRARTLRVVPRVIERLDANQFRYAINRKLGWNTLKSSLYSVHRKDTSLVFIGRGLGHGVGLCQAGAEQMGHMGIPHERILTHYFPGTTVEQLPAPNVPRILSSEHFELIFPPGQRAWAEETLAGLEAARHSLGDRAELLPAKVRASTWDTTAEFIRASGQPGWVAASNDGRTIELQPLRTLKRKGILNSTLRHELTHLVVHRLRSPEVPRWYEEGLVLYLTGEQVGVSAELRDVSRSLEESVSRPRSEAEIKAAYARALERVRDLARRRGAAALWQVLQHPSAEDVLWFRGRP